MRLSFSVSCSELGELLYSRNGLEGQQALIPPPRGHLVRWGGVLAPNAPIRREITRRPEIKKGFQSGEVDRDGSYRNYAWSKMLARVFKLDVETCACLPSVALAKEGGGQLMKVCAVDDRHSIRRYLKSQGRDPDPPPRAPARYRQQELGVGDTIYGDDQPVIDLA